METRKTIGRYEIRDCIGRGGMGALFRGHDPVLDREVAIKTMLADFSRDEDGRTRFYREARAAARLQHRNIVTLFDFGEDEGALYIVMEFLVGQSVAEYVRSGAKLTIERVLDIGAQLCAGLHFAHLRGVIHRDIKPPNIWLNEDGGVKLLDFGIAKFGDTTVTRIGGVVGSLSYMSPEQVSGETGLDGRSDIFSVGIVLYEMLSGQRPFRGETPTAIMMKIIHEPPPPLDVPGVPPQLVAVIEHALEKDRTKRFQDANEMAAELRGVQNIVRDQSSGLARLGATVPPPGPSGAGAALSCEPASIVSSDQDTNIRRGERAASAEFVAYDHHDLMGDWSRGSAEDLVGEAVITPPSQFAALADARAKALSQSAWTGRNAVDWLTRWPTLAVAGGAVAIAGFALVLLMRAESPGISNNGTGKGPPVSVESGKSPGSNGGAGTGANAGSGKENAGSGKESGGAGAGAVGKGTETAGGAPADPGTHPVESDDVHVLLTGPYAFSVLDEQGRAISGLHTKHDLRLAPKQVLRLEADAVYLHQRVTVGGKPGDIVRLQAPAVGILGVRANRETCKIFLNNDDLAYPPIADRRVAAGRYRLTQRCPDGETNTQLVTITPGKTTEVKLFQ